MTTSVYIWRPESFQFAFRVFAGMDIWFFWQIFLLGYSLTYVTASQRFKQACS